jgi:hypothetical protein
VLEHSPNCVPSDTSAGSFLVPRPKRSHHICRSVRGKKLRTTSFGPSVRCVAQAGAKLFDQAGFAEPWLAHDGWCTCGSCRLRRNVLKVENESLEARHFLIAAGAEPVRLGMPGEEHLATHEDFLNLQKLPSRIVLVGGGYIAAEFSHIAAREEQTSRCFSGPNAYYRALIPTWSAG